MSYLYNMGYIYLLTDIRNEKKYVGKHNGNNKNYFSGGIIPNKIIKKYGKEIFLREILEDNINDDELLCGKEIFYIEKYNTFNDGYNLTKGGDGGGNWILKKTEEEKKRISEIKRLANIGRTFSDETLLKMSLAKKGIPLTEDHKKNIVKSQSGGKHPWINRKHKNETKEKISKARKGKMATDDVRKKMSESRRGKKCPWTSEYNTLNNRLNKGIPILINDVFYLSIVEASEKLGITTAIIKNRLNSNKYPNWVRINKKK